MEIPISQQKGYNDANARYWTKPILKINDRHYIMCSEWYSQFREKLDKWINKCEIEIVDSKINVYVLPKAKTKTCPNCGCKTEKKILFVTYHTEIADINNKLFTRRCNICGATYMSDTIFKTYTGNKDIENININFIKKDT